MLELVDIVHEYDGKRLLDGVNFRVDENEVLCLLGPSGGGKSTILKIIAGFEKPLSGSVLFNGRNIINDPVYKRNFGLVFQDYALFPHMSVFENIAFGLKMKGADREETARSAEDALKQVGLDNFGNRKVTELSGGEQQRVALARSLVVHPQLLMLDEPLGALDYSLRQTLIGELRNILGRNGLSAIYVTHDQTEAMSLADRIAILNNGKIIQTDSPENLYANPVNPWCAAFLGFHNFISAEQAVPGTISFQNFSETVYWNIKGIKAPSGKNLTVLLKEGEISADDEADHGTSLVIKAKPVQNLYRGDYYEVKIKIAEGCEITYKSKEKLPTDQMLKIVYPPEGIIVYDENA